MEFTNDYMILPEREHFIVFVNGEIIAYVDTIEEGIKELKEHGFEI